MMMHIFDTCMALAFAALTFAMFCGYFMVPPIWWTLV